MITFELFTLFDPFSCLETRLKRQISLTKFN